MNEDLHIEKAAHLADKPGAEYLATERAKDFVAKALSGSEDNQTMPHSLFIRKPVFAWGSLSVALAVCVALAVVLFRPANNEEGIVHEYGTPGQLLENQSIHAETEVLDSFNSVQSDTTLAIESVVYPEK